MSVDIVAGVTVPVLLEQCERLAAPHRATSGGFQYASALDNSVAVISALSANLLASDSRVSELQAENEKFRAALAPFAEAVDSLMDGHQDQSEIWESPAAMAITAGDLRRARALAKDHPNGQG